MANGCFCVYLDTQNIEIARMTKEEEKECKEAFSWNSALVYDAQLFNRFGDAVKFIDKYESVLNSLDSKKLKSKKGVPKILIKRRYLVLALLGMKNKTTRDYKKDWSIGQEFQLYDQTYFLSVKLTGIKEVIINEKTRYEYSYKVLK